MKDKKRTNMKQDQRRAQLIEVAQELFFSKGFEATTMAEILRVSALSKGGFYHHFASKDELLFAVFEQLTDQIAVGLQAIADDSSLTAKDRMITILSMEGTFYRESNFAAQMDMQSIVNKDQNLGLSQRLNRMIHDRTTPILANIIREGGADGSLDVSDVDTAASLIVYLSRWNDSALIEAYNARGTERAVAAAEHLRAILKQQFEAIDFVLGLPIGTTHFGWPELAEAVIALPLEVDPNAELSSDQPKTINPNL